MDEKIYSPKQFGRLINCSVATLQRWDRAGILKAYRSPTNRRFYTHSQFLAYLGKAPQNPYETININYSYNDSNNL